VASTTLRCLLQTLGLYDRPVADADLELSTLEFSVDGGIATLVLDRPEVHNAFDAVMLDELARVWRHIRHADDIRAVVLTGRGDEAFCTGIDRSVIPPGYKYDPLTYDDPGGVLGPKSQEVWKPIIAAVNGMACGGAFYLLGEADVIVAADHATFFDPHVSYGLVAAFEPILMLRRMPFGEVLRMALVGAHERVSAETAQRIGLVSEVVASDQLMATARQIAEVIAMQPPAALQATLRTLWAARDLPISQATGLGNLFLQLGHTTESMEEGQTLFRSGARPKPRLR
jgi:enoyl-CoA hydratase/carnithine racemase